LLGLEKYDHGRPATVLLRNYAEILPKLSDGTLLNFEALFKRVNATIKT
jgi:hypothetical protein